jgi:hypothetical protein
MIKVVTVLRNGEVEMDGDKSIAKDHYMLMSFYTGVYSQM